MFPAIPGSRQLDSGPPRYPHGAISSGNRSFGILLDSILLPIRSVKNFTDIPPMAPIHFSPPVSPAEPRQQSRSAARDRDYIERLLRGLIETDSPPPCGEGLGVGVAAPE